MGETITVENISCDTETDHKVNSSSLMGQESDVFLTRRKSRLNFTEKYNSLCQVASTNWTHKGPHGKRGGDQTNLPEEKKVMNLREKLQP